MQSENNPTVAVYMITYNHVDYIEEAIEGVVNQNTDFRFKLYLGDDYSTDGTREICIRYARAYPDLIDLYLPDSNLGVSGREGINLRTFNRCFASGAKYLALCEGDDYWINPTKLQDQVELMEKDNGAFGCFHPIRTHFTREGKDHFVNQTINDAKERYYLLDLLKPWFIGTASLVLRMDQVTLPDWMTKVPSGDITLVLSGIRNSYLLCYPVISSVWRVHEGGISVGHRGVRKVMDMSVLYHYINEHYKGRYRKEIWEAMDQEIYMHISRYREQDLINRIKQGKELSMGEHLQALSRKLKRRLFQG